MNIFVIDTSALINDTDLLNKIYGLIVIHNVVLEELDKKTNKSGIVGKNARCVIDKLFQISKRGNIHKGINIGNGVVIKIDDTNPNVDTLPYGLDKNKSDNSILAIYNALVDAHKNDDVYLMTGDKTLSIKVEKGNIKYIGKGGENSNKKRKQSFRNDSLSKKDGKNSHHN